MKTRKFEKKNYVKELVALMRSTLPEKEPKIKILNSTLPSHSGIYFYINGI